jgi:hypothetical protein
MIAIEIAAPIINHRVEVSSDRLPANVAHARIIVLYEEDMTEISPRQGENDPVALARAARASFPSVDRKILEEDFAAMRDEWERES